VLDVVPFTPLDGHGSPVTSPADLARAVAARDRFASWAGRTLQLPCFFYGSERSLPDVRRLAFRGLAPDTGPDAPHPTAGACAVGARPALIAYNLWLSTPDLAVARSIAIAVRGPAVRALGMAAGAMQVSCNLVDPWSVGPAEVYDKVEELARAAGTRIDRAELVGLVPAAVIAAVPRARLTRLDLDDERTIEARLRRAFIG
jgi:glutamate formiminotransferase